MTASGFGADDRVAKSGDTMTGTLALTASTPLQISAGAASGKVLVSDGSGNASWQTSSVVVPLALQSGQATSSILSVQNTTSTPTVGAFRVFSQSAGDRSIGVEVNGDTSRRLAIDSNGKLAWGSGSAVQDVNWYRIAAGVVGTDNTVQAPLVQGSSSASGTLTLSSTSNATRGKVLLGGSSAYDEANVRLGIGTQSPAYPVDVVGAANVSTSVRVGTYVVMCPSGTATTWQTPSYGTGWSGGASGGGLLSCQFRLDGEDNLIIVGAFHSTSATPNSTIFTLPAGWRPAASQRMHVVTTEGGNPSINIMFVQSTGAVQFNRTFSASGVDAYLQAQIPMGNIA